MKIDGTLHRTIPIITPGKVLSQPPKPIRASYASPCTTASIESAISSRDNSENFMPSWFMLMPSETEIVVNSRGVPPASATPSLAASTWKPWVMLHGVCSPFIETTPIIGFWIAASSSPIARMKARCGVRASPSRVMSERSFLIASECPLSRTVVNAGTVLRVIHTHRARPVAEANEEGIPCGEIDFATRLVRVDGARWLAVEDKVPTQAIASDARILAYYLDSFRSFFGNAAGAVEVYWAFLVWLYSAPAAPYLRQAAVPAGIDPWVYPVYAVLFGRSSGGKTLFTKIAARSMFGFEKMIRSGQFTANRALGLRERLGSIPLLIDDVSRDKFTTHVPDLVRTDQEMSASYAPIMLTTNRDVSSIPPDLTKRMVACHIDAAIPENRSVTERIARRALRAIGTALYRAY